MPYRLADATLSRRRRRRPVLGGHFLFIAKLPMTLASLLIALFVHLQSY
jgi:hypothetical protein